MQPTEHNGILSILFILFGVLPVISGSCALSDRHWGKDSDSLAKLADWNKGTYATMKDTLGRTINYLRLSLTDRCNFRCVYCMPKEGVVKLRHVDMLRLEELFEVLDLMATRLGFNKVRITGGEPLVRRGAIGFMKSLGRIPAIDDLSFTTNAYWLEDVAVELHEAGYRRVNISLDTLRRDRFREITGVAAIDQVFRGIEAARHAGFDPIKLNVVSMEENLDEIQDIVAFGVEKGLQVRFIELMPVLGGTGLRFVPNAEVKRALDTRFTLTPIGGDGDTRANDPHAAAEIYRIDGGDATCGFISSVSRPFCSACNRIRLRGDGRLKTCMASNTSFDLVPLIRPDFRADALEAYLRKVIGSKKISRGDYEIESMSAFGG